MLNSIKEFLTDTERMANRAKMLLLQIFRRRNIVLIGGSMLVIGLLFKTDPDSGIMTASFLQELSKPIVAIWFSFLATTALTDYFKGREVFDKAMQSPLGASILYMSRAIIFLAVLLSFSGSVRADQVDTFIPTKAHTYIPLVISEQQKFWPDHPKENCWEHSLSMNHVYRSNTLDVGTQPAG